MIIKELFDKYLKRAEGLFSSDNVVYSMNGSVLTRTDLAEFDLKTILLTEVEIYCKEVGYEVEKVFFLSYFDTNIKEDVRGVNLHSDSRLIILKEGNGYIALVFSGSYIEIK
ncbi:hypothetical protein LCGC14_1838190 [marine sediment metagenome]|uniref:Uncharacterized protein n=1 Tax=marine sediment metagenome TaxID=412755 RepID=A0A0F9H266_9ZZZZ